jgi:regulator of replication initiation timing
MAEKRYRQTITDSNRGLEDQINNLKTELEHLKDLVHKLIKDR